MIKKSLLIGIATSTSDWITDRETILTIGHRFAKKFLRKISLNIKIAFGYFFLFSTWD